MMLRTTHVLATLFALTCGQVALAMAQPDNSRRWSAVDSAMGRAGVAQAGDVWRYSFPRSDMQVTVTSERGAVRVRPALALGGWIAMHPHGSGASVMAMGDLVLADDEVAPVISALQAGGITQSALHHHLLHESPRVLYMHVHAVGDPVAIAKTIRAAMELTKAPAVTPAATPPPPFDLDTAAVARTLGYTGRVNGGVYQVSIPRVEVIRDGGMVVPASMGLGTAINFQPTGGGKAAIAGDFVMTAGEVNAVIRVLREQGIEVTSLHNHLLTDEPRLFFMHFWANADALTLARGLRAALALTRVVPPAAANAPPR
jgi:Domain of Unknown Function (DUF1259)